MIFVILLVILLVFAIASLRIVPEAQTCVIQRFGRYQSPCRMRFSYACRFPTLLSNLRLGCACWRP